ncbi:MAG: hypothetical protein HOP20_03650 [Sulfuriferula sp.]|nr:hypothetical protein [Sulfuriferula sp.]
MRFMNLRNFPEIKINLLSGLIVALALVPEAIAFAFVAHVHPLVGLYAAFMVSLITSLIGGRGERSDWVFWRYGWLCDDRPEHD